MKTFLATISALAMLSIGAFLAKIVEKHHQLTDERGSAIEDVAGRCGHSIYEARLAIDHLLMCAEDRGKVTAMQRNEFLSEPAGYDVFIYFDSYPGSDSTVTAKGQSDAVGLQGLMAALASAIAEADRITGRDSAPSIKPGLGRE